MRLSEEQRRMVKVNVDRLEVLLDKIEDGNVDMVDRCRDVLVIFRKTLGLQTHVEAGGSPRRSGD